MDRLVAEEKVRDGQDATRAAAKSRDVKPSEAKPLGFRDLWPASPI